MKSKILIGHPVSQNLLTDYTHNFDIQCLTSPENKYEELIEKIEAFDALLSMGHPVDQMLLSKGKKLKIVANFGVGYDNIDAEYCRKNGIAVSNTPVATTNSSANFTLGLILSLMRKITTTDRWLRQENKIPFWGHSMIMGNSVEGKTLGIIGMGRIGKALAKRANALGMNIIYHNRNRVAKQIENDLKATYATFDELLQKADIISINAPLNASTEKMIDGQALSKMKKGIYLVNTGRGKIIEEQALIKALQSGHIAGAALDVFEEEPHIPQELKEMDQVILTPHNATGTFEARKAMFEEALNNIIAYLSDKEADMTSRVA